MKVALAVLIFVGRTNYFFCTLVCSRHEAPPFESPENNFVKQGHRQRLAEIKRRRANRFTFCCVPSKVVDRLLPEIEE